MWASPDVMILNPQIPLEIFLPPDDFKDGHILATRDQDGVNTGVFFLQVHPLSVKMLIELLSVPKNEFGSDGRLGQDSSRKAFEKILRSDAYREHVFYQPRRWYNAYQLSPSEGESKRGDLLLHFHGLGGDKWAAMASVIKNEGMRRDWNLPLEQTQYQKEIAEYWNWIREAKSLLWLAREQKSEAHVDPAYRRLQYATTYEVDDVNAMKDAISALREATGIQ